MRSAVILAYLWRLSRLVELVGLLADWEERPSLPAFIAEQGGAMSATENRHGALGS
jgi:hypothetical protein